MNLIEDKKQLEQDLEKLKQQIVGVQYILQYVNGKIKEEEDAKGKKAK